jgi:murein L,D-transpeptidase YcbB/YkuD
MHSRQKFLLLSGASTAIALIAATALVQAQDAKPASQAAKLAIEAGVPMPETANVTPPNAGDIKTETKTASANPVEPASSDKASAEAKPAEAKPADNEAAKPAEIKPAEIKPVEAKPVEAKPAETAPQNAATPAPAAAPAAATASSVPAAERPVADQIKTLIETKLSRYIDRKDERTGAETFYKARDFAPLWVANGVASPAAKAVAATLKKADEDGLFPADYPVPDFAAATSPEALAEAELKLTDTALNYARHAQSGRIHYSRVSGDIAYPDHSPNPADVLANLAKASDTGAALLAYQPPHAGYKALKAKLLEARGAPKVDEPEIVRVPEGKPIKAGKNDPRVVLLRKRLNISEDASSETYDEKVVEAVKAFQKGNGLKADGQLNTATLRKLNGDKEKPVGNVAEIIAANMERWRWVPRQLGEPKLGNAYVILNIPDFTLKVMQNDKTVWNTRVVTGKPGRHATPMLSETMKFITVNPTWNVPPSIVYGEYLPALQQDPNVLNRMGLKLTQNRDGSVHIAQPPGERNALGRIRFNFPNKFLVYQHDTPDKHLFAHDSRAYSHGCMRVQNPDQYAEAVLGIVLPKDGYSAAKIRSMYGNSELNINFPTPLPVNITYQTAFVDDAGKLQLRKDIYGRDAATIAQLKDANRKNGEIAVSHSQPNYSRPSVQLPQGVAFAGSGFRNDGPNFFERLFGGGAPEPEPVSAQRRPRPRQSGPR